MRKENNKLLKFGFYEKETCAFWSKWRIGEMAENAI